MLFFTRLKKKNRLFAIHFSSSVSTTHIKEKYYFVLLYLIATNKMSIVRINRKSTHVNPKVKNIYKEW